MGKNKLSSKDVKTMIAIYKATGDINMRNKAIESCLYLCEPLARKYSVKFGVDYDDLFSYAYEGLFDAIEAYNITNKNSIYAFVPKYITARILKGICELKGITCEYYYRLYRLCEDIESKTGNYMKSMKVMEQAISELVKEYDFSQTVEKKLKNAVALNNPVSYSRLVDSIYEKQLLEDEIELEDKELERPEFSKEELDYLTASFIGSISRGETEFAYVLGNEIKDRLDDMLSKMKPRYQDILEKRYGLHDQEKLSLRSIAGENNQTFANIQAMEKYILDIIRNRKPKAVRELASLRPCECYDLYDGDGDLTIQKLTYHRKKPRN